MTLEKTPCMSRGGLPMFPFVVMGGFLPENNDEGNFFLLFFNFDSFYLQKWKKNRFNF